MNDLFLSTTLLFRGTAESDIEPMLQCLGAHTKTFSKRDIITHSGEVTESIGLVLSGSVTIEHDDIWGNKSILNHLVKGQIFAEAYACIPGEPLMINVIAAEKTEILFLNTLRLMNICPNSCSHHSQLVKNLLQIMAKKNLDLSRRILHTSSKSIRGRLLSYFSEQAVQNENCQFEIPFNRQQLADYLSVNRSALSNELSKMQRDGILTYEKKKIILKQNR